MEHPPWHGFHRSYLGLFLSEVSPRLIAPDDDSIHSTLIRQYTRESIAALDGAEKLDIYDKGYVERIWLYIFCGLLDAMWQTTAYWLMGAMSNDPAKLAHFTGFCLCPPWMSSARSHICAPQINQSSLQELQVFGAQMLSGYRK